MRVVGIPKLNSMKSYVSSMKVKLEEDYCNDSRVIEFFRSIKYKRIVKKMKQFYVNKAVEGKTNLVDCAPSMTPQDNIAIGGRLLMDDTSDSREDRCLLNMNYQAIGRISEPSTLLKENLSSSISMKLTAIVLSLGMYRRRYFC
jgi:hypothetical protein